VFPTPQAAVRAAYEVLDQVRRLQAEGNPFTIRIGINGGRAIRANVGGLGRREYTYIGDAVNLAQRMESNATPGYALISATVADQLQLPFPRVEMREVTVKGKVAPVLAYECGL
jgi:class 3 adenylate cyclase